MSIPTPKFDIGDTVYCASTMDGSEETQCPDCLGSKKWKVITPAGDEWEHACLRCEGRGVLRLRTFAPIVPRRTIGSVRINTADNDRAISYMCRETGVGSGSVYYEPDLFSSEEEARSAAELKAIQQTRELDESSSQKEQRAEWREIREYRLNDAKVEQAERKARDWQYRYKRLVDRVCELDNHPVAKWEGEITSTSLSDEQVKAIQDSLLYLDEHAARQLEDYRDAAECRC